MSGIKMSVLPEMFVVAKIILPTASTGDSTSLLSTLCRELEAPSMASSPIFLQRTPTEFSIIMGSDRFALLKEASLAPSSTLEIDDNWNCFMVHGPMPFDLVGVMAKLSNTLADSKISLLAQSTFDTDYVFVKSSNLDSARSAFAKSGIEFLSL
jgi:hypothetical protein